MYRAAMYEYAFRSGERNAQCGKGWVAEGRSTASSTAVAKLRPASTRMDDAREEKEIYYSITAEMILAQPSSHSVPRPG